MRVTTTQNIYIFHTFKAPDGPVGMRDGFRMRHSNWIVSSYLHTDLEFGLLQTLCIIYYLMSVAQGLYTSIAFWNLWRDAVCCDSAGMGVGTPHKLGVIFKLFGSLTSNQVVNFTGLEGKIPIPNIRYVVEFLRFAYFLLLEDHPHDECDSLQNFCPIQ